MTREIYFLLISFFGLLFTCWCYFFWGNGVCMGKFLIITVYSARNGFKIIWMSLFIKRQEILQVSINVACPCCNIRWTWWVGKISFQNKIKCNQITSSKVIEIKSLTWVNIWVNSGDIFLLVDKHCTWNILCLKAAQHKRKNSLF